MRADLAYGKKRLEVNLPGEWDITIVEPQFLDGVIEPASSILDALDNPIGVPPLNKLLSTDQRIGIVINDITRATPTQMMVQTIVGEVLKVVSKHQITIFVALGTHRKNTEAELRNILGDYLHNSFSIVQNNPFDKETQLYLGKTTRGHEIWINRDFAECDLHILTGFIEPHFFAGFSGGGKAIMPGMGGLETIMENHSAEMIASPNATWGVTHGNPIWEEIQEISQLFNPFLVNVAMNRDKQITRVFVGDLIQAHEAGCKFAKQTAMAPVNDLFDIVVTSNSGYPLDLNLYQAVKGMSAAAKIVKDNGVIIMAAECWDGIPEHGKFADLISGAISPAALLESILSPGFKQQDQWQAQVLAQILLKADIYVHSENLTEEVLETFFLKAAADLETTLHTLSSKFAGRPRLCLLPEGPLTIPYVQ